MVNKLTVVRYNIVFYTNLYNKETEMFISAYY